MTITYGTRCLDTTGDVIAVFHDEGHGWMAEIQWANTDEPLSNIPAHLITEHIRMNRMRIINPEQFLREVDPETQSSLSSPSEPAGGSFDEHGEIGDYGFEVQPNESVT